MLISRLRAKNWRNFTYINVKFSDITYIVGANASGKSNFLDIFRFLRDIANQNGGGLQKAVKDRGGMTKLRCLAARKQSDVELHIELVDSKDKLESDQPDWKYSLCLHGGRSSKQAALIRSEDVYDAEGKNIHHRPGREDSADSERLTQTSLEQINANNAFRPIATFFQKTLYLHLVPQLLKYPQLALQMIEADPFGQGFLGLIANATSESIRKSRLGRIEEILKKVIPHLKDLCFVRDGVGVPHLESKFHHWRKDAVPQREDQFSDGTLRLIALMWTLMSTNDLVLLEEPELSLHVDIVEQIPDIIRRTRASRKVASGQVLVSTHSERMLSDKSIDGRTILYIRPGEHGEASTLKTLSATHLAAVEAGMPPATVVFPLTGHIKGRLIS